MTTYLLYVTRGWYDEQVGTLYTDDPAVVRMVCELLHADAEPVMTVEDLQDLTWYGRDYERHI